MIKRTFIVFIWTVLLIAVPLLAYHYLIGKSGNELYKWSVGALITVLFGIAIVSIVIGVEEIIEYIKHG